MVVYKATSKTSGKSYIGITNDFDRRRKQHKSLAKNPKTHFHNAIKVYGFDDFLWEVLEECANTEELYEREIALIKEHNTFDNGYNMTIGGEGNLEPTMELRNRWSEARKGKTHSEETKRLISESRKGISFSDEHKASLKESRNNRDGASDETRAKMSKNRKGKLNIKIFICIDPDGNEYETKNGLTKFCEEYNLTPSNMHKVLKGERKTHKGWTIRRKE